MTQVLLLHPKQVGATMVSRYMVEKWVRRRNRVVRVSWRETELKMHRW